MRWPPPQLNASFFLQVCVLSNDLTGTVHLPSLPSLETLPVLCSLCPPGPPMWAESGEGSGGLLQLWQPGAQAQGLPSQRLTQSQQQEQVSTPV